MTERIADRIIAVDLDGVLHDYKHPLEGKKFGKPLQGAHEALETLSEHGYTIIVFTTKAATETGKQAVEDWLEFYDMTYHDVTATKPDALVYIDDRAVRHTDWPKTLQEIAIIRGQDFEL